MDAHALLTSQGWRGTGNSLHPTSNTIGLSRPLLVSKKVDNLGIGKKQHRTSDMWWMNAFDSSLKGLDTSKEGQVVQTVTSGGLDMVQKAGAKWVGSKGGLYASFVRGEGLGGTIEKKEEESSESGKESGGDKKRKRGEESKEERSERRAAKKALKNERVELVMRELRPVETETKEERKTRRAAERARREQEVEIVEVPVGSTPVKIETKGERKARRAAERELRKKPTKLDEEPKEDVEMKDASIPETKEERKERRRLKKLAKEAGEKQDSSEDSTEKSKKKKRMKD
ncbi:hypothetical protein WAI453_011501 [Rhynchosporium graminicola]|uniref:Uncharacterized protein n=1 Tax=Rhynchosporium graminicola TaxID=2792576 RepID=A0A1E1L1R4_9HELO|nr:uncharacterized protein RCO7_09990 [Rhynchosporium commune]